MEEEFVYQVIAKGANYNITGVRVCSLLFVMFPVNPCGAKPFRASRSAGDDEDCINICLYHFILILGEDNRKEKFLKESSSNHSFFGEIVGPGVCFEWYL